MRYQIKALSRWLRAIAAAAENRLALLHEGSHALGIIGREARLTLQLALELEMALEIIVPGFIEGALGQREPDGRRRGELGAKPLRFRHQFLPALRQHLWQTIGIGGASRDKMEFERGFYRAFPEAIPKQNPDQFDFLDQLK